MRVLFVDDEPRVLEGLRRMLSAGTWTIDTATSGTDALEILEKARFDVIVTDMRMPGMDGAQLLGHVHERWPSVTRIVLSGQTEREHAMRALGSAHQFLSKPCTARVLIEVVENAFYLQALTPNAKIRDLASSAHLLPSLPKIHQQILKVIDGPDASVREAAELVARDPGICAKVLRIVNSAFFARGQIVRDVRTATARVGLDLLRALVLTENVATGIPVRRLEQLQAAALDGAGSAGAILPEEERRAAFTAALLGDVGSLVLERGAPDEMRAVYANARENGIPIHFAEKAVLGSSHADVGGYVLGVWGVPPVIVDAVLGHHELGRDPSVLSAAVHVAHRIVANEPVTEEAAERAGVRETVGHIRAAYVRGKSAT